MGIRRARGLHRILGLVLVAPLVGWSVTGFLFFLKPGWDEAYGPLPVRAYPLAEATAAPVPAGWLELRRTRSILGEHLIVRTEEGWGQLDPSSLTPRALPAPAEIERLVDDALAANRRRYGTIVGVTGLESGDSAVVRTTTGARIDLDWNRMQLTQSGADTRRIDALYRIHYLQWTGLRTVDRALGVAGLVGLLLLAGLGVRIARRDGAPS